MQQTKMFKYYLYYESNLPSPLNLSVQEGEDKKFLITRLQSIHEQKRTPSRRPRRQVSF